MKISELPTAIRNRAERYRDQRRSKDAILTKTDSLIDAFLWEGTKEGAKYWENLHNEKEFFTLERNE